MLTSDADTRLQHDCQEAWGQMCAGDVIPTWLKNGAWGFDKFDREADWL